MHGAEGERGRGSGDREEGVYGMVFEKLNPSWTARWLLLLVLELPDLTNPYYRKDVNNFFV